MTYRHSPGSFFSSKVKKEKVKLPIVMPGGPITLNIDKTAVRDSFLSILENRIDACLFLALREISGSLLVTYPLQDFKKRLIVEFLHDNILYT